MTPTQVYEELERNVLTVLKSFHTDLSFHDHNWILANKGVPFLHAANTNGTHLVGLVSADMYPAAGVKVRYLFSFAGREHILSQVVDMAETLVDHRGFDAKICHYFDGEKLRKVNRLQFVSIARDYAARIKDEWMAINNKPHIFDVSIQEMRTQKV